MALAKPKTTKQHPEAKTDKKVKAVRMHEKSARPLLLRTAVFLVICLAWTGLIGPYIIGSGLLHKGHFDIYGGLGKALLFGVVALGLLVRRKGSLPAIPAWRPRMLSGFGLSIASFLGAWITTGRLVSQLDANPDGPLSLGLVIATHALLLLSIVAAALGAFGLSTLYKLYDSYRRQLLVAAGLAIGFFAFLTAVYAAWQPLAGIVLHAVHWMFNLIGLPSEIIPPRSLLFDKFGIEIAQYCSGIESIALFTGLYVIIGVLDWERFNHRRLLIAFLPALTLLFICNILRVFLLIAAGYYLNPQLAFSLFHTYAGMVFFLLYSGLFWGIMYKRLLRQPAANKPVETTVGATSNSDSTP